MKRSGNRAARAAAAAKRRGPPPAPPRRGTWKSFKFLVGIVRLGWPQKWLLGVYIGLYLLASAIQTAGLFCFNAGFSIVGAGHKAAGGTGMHLATRAMDLVGIPPDSRWVVFFAGFVLLNVVAVAMDHLGWVMRLRLLSVYEANQMCNGLTIMCDLDPRDLASVTRRELIYALRSDCKSMRVVFQLQLLTIVALAQVVLPFFYIFTMDVTLSMVGLLALLASFYPIYLLGKKTGRNSLRRQEVSVKSGMQMSRMIADLQSSALTDQEKSQGIQGVRTAIADQQYLWRQQYAIRSLCEKIPQWSSMLGTFVILLVGVTKINSQALTWAQLMTFVLAIRMVFAPFSGIGMRSAKTSEHLLRAIRHLDFIRRFKETGQETGKQDLPTRDSRVEITSLQLADLPLAQGRESRLPPLNLALQPGDCLTVVDPAMDGENPIFRYLTGFKYVPAGDILVNGLSLNSLRSRSVERAHTLVRISHDLRSFATGTVFECMRKLAPDLTREQAREFAVAILGPKLYDSVPGGLDTYICYETKKTGSAPMLCFWLVSLFRKRTERRRIQVVDAFEKLGNVQLDMLRNFIQLYRQDCIALWFDRAPREDIPNQHVVAFQEGNYLGHGDEQWFKQTFPDWQKRVARRALHELRDVEDEELILIEEVEEEMLDEDL